MTNFVESNCEIKLCQRSHLKKGKDLLNISDGLKFLAEIFLKELSVMLFQLNHFAC